ncbi:MAG: ComF family protein [Candidatus Jacksonbacteria bacterium]|nr:ComF family protein [Candidatus Jacksonbacteria bacterium]MBT6301570.1 ComF family protein [Candidatus Jacksonbacteria bacterium]MBT6757081.1 ComF family protein [Candidatus Jacksonbacteria bacterium]MBT6955100.1 ComF family protein [Candidatus Jacksonbacteria bacterium]
MPCQQILSRVTPNIYLEKDSPLSGIIAAHIYQEAPDIAQAIHLLKYSGQRVLAQPLSAILSSAISHALLRGAITTPLWAIAIPLHPRRYRERGFNQNDEIGNFLPPSITFIPNILSRKKYTPSQIMLSKEKRIQNIKDAFECSSQTPQEGTILLLDDVTTTGTTLKEAAKKIKQQTDISIWGCVLAQD